MAITVKEIEHMSLVFTVVVFLVTVFRLSVRGPRRWWWDDLCATIGFVALMFQMIILWLRIQAVPALAHNQKAEVVLLYFNNVSLYVEDWTARLAILFSIIRITPTRRARKLLYGLVVAFILAMLVNTALLVAFCQENKEWQKLPSPKCTVPQAVPIYQIVTGITADTILIAVPIQTLKMLTSAPLLRKRMIFIFSSSILITIACVTQSAISLTIPGLPQLVASLVEGFVALMVCNMTVVGLALLYLGGSGKGLIGPANGQGISTAGMPFRGATPRSGTNLHTVESDAGSDVKRGSAFDDARAITTFRDRWRYMDVDVEDADLRTEEIGLEETPSYQTRDSLVKT